MRPNERGNFTPGRFVVTVKLLSAAGVTSYVFYSTQIF